MACSLCTSLSNYDNIVEIHQRGGEWWIQIKMALKCGIKKLADEVLQEGGRRERTNHIGTHGFYTGSRLLQRPTPVP